MLNLTTLNLVRFLKEDASVVAKGEQDRQPLIPQDGVHIVNVK